MSLDEDSNEQDCTVYIEQLKSDTAALKLNAASKLGVIASVLGHNRIRDQLIPYLIEIIEQMDNQNDFLIKIAQGLLDLKQYCRSVQQSYILIQPLKILATLDQPAVRDKAVESLKKLAQKQDFGFFKKHYYPLIKQLSLQTGPYSPRVSVCGLIPICYPNLDSEKQLELNSIFRKLASDDSPMVRRSLAQNIQPYSRVVSKNVSKTDLFQIWQSFIGDKIDIVKIKALQIAPIIAKFFKKEQIHDKFFKSIRIVDANKKSWRIRYTLIECLAAMMQYFDKQTIKKDVVQVFQQMLKDSQQEVRCIALLKLPDLSQKLSSQQSYTVFFQYIQKSASQQLLNIKLALVQSIISYFASIQKQKVTQNGIPIVQSLIKDENPSVRAGIVQRLKNLMDILGDDNTKKYLIPMLEGTLTDKKWRFKLTMVESLPNLFKNLQYNEYKQFINKMLNALMKDHYYAVRQQVIKCVVELHNIYGGEIFYEIWTNIINTLLANPNYVYRSTAYQLFAAAYETLDKKLYNQLFMTTITKKIEGQKIANVFLAFLSTHQKFKNSLNSQSKKQFSTLSRKIRDQNKDQDVLFYLAQIQQ